MTQTETVGIVVASVLLALLAAACGGSPTGPDGIPRGGVVSELRITGLPHALSPGSTAQLTAQAVLDSGLVSDCAAAWSVDDTKVASVSSVGLLTAGITGFVNVAASCRGLTTRAEAKVEAVRSYHVVIVPYDREMHAPPDMKPLPANMQFLDGPRAGQSIPVANFYRDGMTDVPWPVKVRFTADGYEPKDFTLSETTGERPNQTSNWFDFWVPMTFIPPDALTDTYVREVSQTEPQIVHPFTMPMPGVVEVRTWWWGDFNTVLEVGLWCGGLRRGSGGRSGGAMGEGFTANIPLAGPCEVRVQQRKGYPRYRVAIRYAR